MAMFPEMNPGPVCRMDRTGTVLLANKAARQLFGETSLIGQLWGNLCPGFTADMLERILQSDTPIQHETEVGKCFIMFSYILAEQKDSVFSFGTDITARRIAERKITEQSQKLAEVARFPDMNPGPVVRTDFDGCILLANRAARTVFGDDLIGQQWSDVCKDITEKLWDRILGTSEVVPVECRLKDSEYVFSHVRDERTRLVFVFGTDITQQKRAERTLHRVEKMSTLGTLAAGIAHELNNPAAAVRRAGEQVRSALERLERSRSELSSLNLSEEAKRTLRVLEELAKQSSVVVGALSSLELLAAEEKIESWLEQNGISSEGEIVDSLVSLNVTPGDLENIASVFPGDTIKYIIILLSNTLTIYSLLHEITNSATRISEIVEAMKSYTYLGQAPVQEINVHDGIDNTLVILRDKLKAGITVHRKYGADVPRIMAYGSELNQVWTSIISNAIDAVSGKGEITISSHRESNRIVVEIEDNGSGITPEILPHIFEPFYTTKEPGKGTGLGLSTSYGIITEKHAGELLVESKAGTTRFIVRLPIESKPAHGQDM